MNRSFVLAVAALLLVAAGSWWWAVRAVPSAGPPVDETDETEETDDAPPSIDEPADPPAAATAQPVAPAPAAPLPAALPPAVAPPPPVVTPVPAPPAPAPSMAAQVGSLQRLKHAFEADPIDPQARAAEGEIGALFGSGENTRDTLLGVRCKQRACRIELRWSPDRPYSFMVAGTELKDKISEDMAVEPIGVPDNTGARRMYVYVARAGYLPQDFDPVPEAPVP